MLGWKALWPCDPDKAISCWLKLHKGPAAAGWKAGGGPHVVQQTLPLGAEPANHTRWFCSELVQDAPNYGRHQSSCFPGRARPRSARGLGCSSASWSRRGGSRAGRVGLGRESAASPNCVLAHSCTRGGAQFGSRGRWVVVGSSQIGPACANDLRHRCCRPPPQAACPPSFRLRCSGAACCRLTATVAAAE